ncbi:hypothetical protein M231_01665 [Tremella mesenterica]|uniref:RING-type domain-containing protein n=1 Tax=Tremella mesenterica TaxID=5217 RepID=A0A4Q1BSM4_TREME|nr:hypothetical protein M231_01665 [Tremella mesenterica]
MPNDELNLTDIGVELDEIRQIRHLVAPPVEETVPESHQPVETSSSADPSLTSKPDLDNRPLPLCLLCLTRPPTAVLLPCCHLNLCYLCAPLLILRGRPCFPPSSSQPSPHVISEPIYVSESPHHPRPVREPWNITLLRATANHPKSRRLCLAGYIPPISGKEGGEYRAQDLLNPTESIEDLCSTLGDDGRITLSSTDNKGASCPLCRAGVSGWLRVYTG